MTTKQQEEMNKRFDYDNDGYFIGETIILSNEDFTMSGNTLDPKNDIKYFFTETNPTK